MSGGARKGGALSGSAGNDRAFSGGAGDSGVRNDAPLSGRAGDSRAGDSDVTRCLTVSTASMSEERVDRLQDLTIFLLTLTAVVLLVELPLFGALSDTSLLELAERSLRREPVLSGEVQTEGGSKPVLPLRLVYTNGFARLGVDALTTQSDEFEHAGVFLGEALGSAGDMRAVSESAFLDALWQEGLYFDLTAPTRLELLCGLTGVTGPPEPEEARRILLSPRGASAVMFLQDGEGRSLRFDTAVSSDALRDFLASQSGKGAEFAGLMGEGYEHLSPYTLLIGAPELAALTASNALAGNEDQILRRSEFNPHTENRFTESSGTVIVREVTSTLYLRPDGVAAYQGSEIPAPGSAYFVRAASPGLPTLFEAASAAQAFVSAVLQDVSGETALFLSGAQDTERGYELLFDLMADGAPIRFADGSHAAAVTVEGQRISAFSIRVRRYVPGEEPALLLPFGQAAAIARTWEDAELVTAYVDNGSETAAPVWLADS